VDGAGTLAVGTGGFDGGAGHLVLFAADGSPRSTHDYQGLRSVAPQQEGFSALVAESGGYAVYSLASDGSEIGRVGNVSRGLIGIPLFATDPRGGFVIATADAIQSFDARSARRWSVPIGDIHDVRHSIVADVSGSVLFLFDAGGRFGTVKVAGLPITADGDRKDIFAALPSKFTDTWLSTAPALGGGIFVQELSPLGAEWVRLVDGAAASSEAAPPWLARRGSWSPGFAHGRRAYALRPSERGASSPTCTVEVVTPAGESCGAIELDNPSGSCDSAAEITVGIDGTLVQSLGRPRTCSGEACVCSWRVWNGYLR